MIFSPFVPIILNFLLSFEISTIAEKTGFPQEMIEPGMDLEEDLAVDSIRRVEILGAVQENFPTNRFNEKWEPLAIFF